MSTTVRGLQGEGPQVEGMSMFASALAGKTIHVRSTEPGEPSWTDGNVVYVDPTADTSTRRVSLAVHACLVAGGSLSPEVVRGLGRRTDTAARFLAVESHRVLDRMSAFLPGDVLDHIDHAVAAGTDGPAASLAIAKSKEPIAPAPRSFGEVRARAVLSAVVTDDVSSGGGSHRSRSADRDDPVDMDDEAEEAADDLPDLYTSPVGGGGGLGSLLRKLLGASRKSGEGGGPPGADSATHRGRRGLRGAGAVSSRSSVETDIGAVTTGPLTYPEWDMHRRAYHPGWCTVEETKAELGEDGVYEWDRHALRRPLARLAMAPAAVRRRPKGDDLDLDALVDSRVALAAGATPDEGVYIDSVRSKRELSVLVLLDVSGSVGEKGGGGETIHELQRAAAAAIVSTLHELGDRVALYAFRSRGRAAVNLAVIKRFDDAFGAETVRRLHGVTPGAYSRLGAAIRHGSAVLSRDGGTKRKLLVVLSDGLAYDHGYELNYGAVDARRALAEARRDHIGAVCLTIGAPTGDQELARVFGGSAHVRVPDLRELPAVVGPLFKTALRTK